MLGFHAPMSVCSTLKMPILQAICSVVNDSIFYSFLVIPPPPISLRQSTAHWGSFMSGAQQATHYTKQLVFPRTRTGNMAFDEERDITTSHL